MRDVGAEVPFEVDTERPNGLPSHANQYDPKRQEQRAQNKKHHLPPLTPLGEVYGRRFTGEVTATAQRIPRSRVGSARSHKPCHGDGATLPGSLKRSDGVGPQPNWTSSPQAASMTRGRAIRTSAVIATWIASTVLLVEPLQAAWLNWDELAINLPTLFQRLVPLLGGAALGLAALGAALCALAPTRGLALWTALGVAAWAQADLFAWQYTTFDGTPTDWSIHANKAWLEAALWLGAPAIAVWRAPWVARNALRAVAGVVVLQIAGLAATLSENWPLAEKPTLASLASSRTQEFSTFALEGNVLIILLDMVQSDIFSEALALEAPSAPFPDGFVYFRNAASLYTSTQFSAQSVLTSQAVPEEVDAHAWRRSAMVQSLPALLSERGYDAALASIAPHTIGCERKIPGVHCKPVRSLTSPNIHWTITSTWRREVNLLVHLAVFRLTPHAIKPQVYDEGQWHIPAPYPLPQEPSLPPGIHSNTLTDLKILDGLINGVRRSPGPPRFRFLHLFGAHFPATVDPLCAGPASGSIRERSVSTTRCMIRKLTQLFFALQEAGLYEDMAIAIVSDHGLPTVDLDPRAAKPPLPAAPSGQASAAPGFSMGVPMFLVKAPHARGPLKVSDRPVSLCDVPATVVDMLGIDEDLGFSCESVFAASRENPRMHYRYPSYRQQNQRPRARRYFFKFKRYQVDGHSWHPGSWVTHP